MIVTIVYIHAVLQKRPGRYNTETTYNPIFPNVTVLLVNP